MSYFTIREIKEANKAAAKYFFSPSTMRFFNSRILRGVIGGKYFITSEKFDRASRRYYTVREALPNGHIRDASEFLQFATPAQARAFARKLAVEDARIWASA